MNSEPSAREPARRHPWPWIAAATLALAAHGLWFAVLESTGWSIPRNTLPEATSWRLVTWSAAEGKPDWLARMAPWSPAILALPSENGFSRPLITSGITLRPPLGQPVQRPMTLERDAWRSGVRTEVSRFPWSDVRAPTRLASALPTEPAVTGVDVPRAGIRPTIPYIESMHDGDDRIMEPWVATENVALWGTAPWNAELFLMIDGQGTVRQALLEQRTPDPKVNEQLIRHALTWRWSAADGPTTARLRLQYPGRPPAREGEAR